MNSEREQRKLNTHGAGGDFGHYGETGLLSLSGSNETDGQED